jgi:hypothetical protein
MKNNQTIHYSDRYNSIEVEYREILREEGLHTDARLCDGNHSKLSMPAPTSVTVAVTCKRCLKKLKKGKY